MCVACSSDWCIVYADSYQDESELLVLWQWSGHLTGPQVGSNYIRRTNLSMKDTLQYIVLYAEVPFS